ncbi:MAG: ATP-binding protein [Anaerolineae bacterium]|jgi:hypothetical protein|nr:ATP-binding protein [Anaerolineae bacterium]
MTTGWICPQCGKRDARQITLYREGLFNAASRRFDPSCTLCGSRLTFDPCRSTATPSAPVLVVSGSCASGKTTISYLLSEHYGFVQIDGDWVLESRKAEEQRHIDFNEIHTALLTMALGVATLGKPVALAHVVAPDVVPPYKAFLHDRHIPHRIVILMPALPTLLERNAVRVCWPKTTPELWVRKFYDDYLTAPDEIRALFYDNTGETPEATAARLSTMVTSPDHVSRLA